MRIDRKSKRHSIYKKILKEFKKQYNSGERHIFVCYIMEDINIETEQLEQITPELLHFKKDDYSYAWLTDRYYDDDSCKFSNDLKEFILEFCIEMTKPTKK